MTDDNPRNNTDFSGYGWKVLQVIFNIFWGIGYLGNSFLFLRIEWSYLSQSFIQIFNPFLHIQIIVTLLANPLFWIFLAMAILGYYATIEIEKQLEKSNNLPDLKIDKIVSNPPLTAQTKQSCVLASSPVRKATNREYTSRQSSYKRVNKLENRYIGQQVKLLKWAIQSSQKVQFSYEKRNGEKSDRVITPTGFKTVKKTLYLEGYCHLRRAKRKFAIKWMKEIEIVSPNKTTYELQSPSQDAIKTKPTDVETQKRPYIKFHIDELERTIDLEWNNLEVLREIYCELEFRSRKKADFLRDRISQRITQLQEAQFRWPTTTATSGLQSLSSDVFKYEEGLLKQCGYKVGANGLPESQRRQILDSIFLRPLPFIVNTTYLNKWGEPNTDKRLQKLAESIAAFTRNAKRRKTSNLIKAIQDWEADLAYLKRTYYDGRFYFQWPRTGAS